ncbi:MAG: universal stress protein [Desulfatirhabdiaceae bacterium]
MDILVAYEESEVGRIILETAIRHAKAFNAKLFLVMSMMGGGEVPDEVFVNAEKLLEKAKKRCTDESIECETRMLVRGLEPGDDIVRFAEEKQIDEIIIGIKKKSKLGKLLFGSNAQYMILNAPCPVLTVK